MPSSIELRYCVYVLCTCVLSGFGGGLQQLCPWEMLCALAMVGVGIESPAAMDPLFQITLLCVKVECRMRTHLVCQGSSAVALFGPWQLLPAA